MDAQDVERLTTGSEHRDGREGGARASIWLIYQRLGEVLSNVGSSLDLIVRQRILVSNPSDVLPVEEVLSEIFDETTYPSTVFNCEYNHGRGGSRTIAVEVVALREWDGAVLSRIRLPELTGLTDPYPQATRVGQLMFSSSIWTDTSASGGNASTADRKLHRSGRILSDQTQRSLRSQLVETYRQLEAILQSQGAALSELLRQTIFTNSDRQAWGFTTIERQQLFRDPSDFPTASAFGVPDLSPSPSVEVVTDAIGLADGPWKKQVDVMPDVAMGHLPMAIGAGPFVFTTGYVGMDKASHRTITSYSDLAFPAVDLGTTIDDRWEALRAQTWHIYRQIATILERSGSSLQKTVQQSIYLTDVAGFSVVESVGCQVFGENWPATTVTGVQSVGPYPGAEVEIDVIAHRDNA